MGLRRLLETVAAGSAFALAALAAPAFASEGAPLPPPPPADYAPEMMHHQGYMPPADLRDSWLAECRDRLRGEFRRREAAERCERYFDGYYERYRVQPMAQGYGPGPAYGYPGDYYQGYACCQQPMMMMPAMRPPAPEPKCTETVEYEYVDVPVRRPPPPPRPIPDKRVKIVPDKRIKVK